MSLGRWLFPLWYADPLPKVVVVGTNATEALKFIHEWSKWLVVIETGAAGAVGGIWKLEPGTPNLHWTARAAATLAVAHFGISICWAAHVLLSLPGITQRVEHAKERRDIDVFHMGTLDGGGLRLFVLVQAQNQFFLAGFFWFGYFLWARFWNADKCIHRWVLVVSLGLEVFIYLCVAIAAIRRGRKDSFRRQVEKRAFRLWEQAGRPEGMAEHFWLQAEAEARKEPWPQGGDLSL
jgi:hypothetical protein